MVSREKSTSQPDGQQKPSVPSISLPKGGGAIRGIGEKFAANPVTGTGSITVPIATSPGRSGFGPQLSLSYDSGSGNGPFGFGWSLSLSVITRKTDKGLPRYQDAAGSDEFILSGAEDLVPVLVEKNRQWEREELPLRPVEGRQYSIERYRPRIEGLFARIERWTNPSDPTDTFWRSISKDNITTWYGRSESSRIVDPDDKTRIFSWLICESYDDKGNVILYKYKEEDSNGVVLSQAHERNRTDKSRSANRYLKSIRYGNHKPYFPEPLRTEPWPTPPGDDKWFFEVVFDYGEHDPDEPKPDDSGQWDCRNDPFSTYRAGFEVRTYRLCQRVLTFHHIPDLSPDEKGYEGLVRSTDFTYRYEQDPADARNPIYSFLVLVSQSGYKRQGAGYLKKSLPPLEFGYSPVTIQETIEEVDAGSLENLPVGLDGVRYHWIDLDGVGISGILTEQAGGWFYKRNLSPVAVRKEGDKERTVADFSPVERVTQLPSMTGVSAGRQQFLDLAGDGQLDLIALNGPVSGFYERTLEQGWTNFRSFRKMPNIPWEDPNLRFVDLTGDGHADVLITEHEVLTWYPSLAEEGFGPGERVQQALDEEKGPRVVFADGTQSIQLADLSGDGLSDLVRIRNGEVCYWPNLGYGKFGAKVTMDNGPWFDKPDQFDQKRIRLVDIDGSGTTDIIYLAGDDIRIYYNQSGNRWSDAVVLSQFPRVDDLSTVMAVDLLGNGTACLVWSSPLPDAVDRPMRYIDLMGGQKPHLLIKTTNNLGAETHVQYAPSTKFYLKDKLDGNPWITRLPFPVHVVERVETYDQISRNRFVTCYAYHHGYFDGEEREFRGFGMVEQWDTEEYAALTESGAFPIGDNVDAASHVPPVLTRTWFHTGIYLGRERVSKFFAGMLDSSDKGEYYREPGLDDLQAETLLLDDTVLPDGLTSDEERQAARSLKGTMLRQEVYALDGVGVDADYPHGHPYTVAEQNFTIRLLQPQGANRHAVFFTHPREAITYHYERESTDPRIQHALTLEVDDFGNVLKAAAVGYGRRLDASAPGLLPEDRRKQRLIHITTTENRFTKPIVDQSDDYRTPLPAETRTYELRKPQQEMSGSGLTALYRFNALSGHVNQAGDGDHDVDYEDILFDRAAQAAATDDDEGQRYFRRLIERVHTVYRKDDLSALLPPGGLESLALPGESYKLALTPGLLAQVFRRGGKPLLPADPGLLLEGQGEDGGGYVAMDGGWWIPSGRVFYSTNAADGPAAELSEAQAHFFLPRRFYNPFGQNTLVTYDGPADEALLRYDLLVTRTEDAVHNVVSAENDYRVLSPRRMTDANRNRTEVAFDALGMVAGTAVMGKPLPSPAEGDSLGLFKADLTQADVDGFYDVEDPHAPAPDLLRDTTTRIVYDLDRFQRLGEPPFAATLARETHAADPPPPQGLKIRISFSYSDGFGREIQKKIQAEPGEVEVEDAAGNITLADTSPNLRWVGRGWTIFNNKGKPVRQYEPFFSTHHQFQLAKKVGVSPILFYDPVERVVATLHPNHTYEKMVFDPWQQTTYDVNDTVTFDPKADPDVGSFFTRLPDADYLPTWQQQRNALAASDPERVAADKAAGHADTPAVAHLDTLGRTFLTFADNGPDPAHPGQHLLLANRVELDIEGNPRTVRDAIEQVGDQPGRIVMRYDYDLLGNRIHQASMDAGERWMLNDVAGKPLYVWDSRGFGRRMTYDLLRRPTGLYVAENAAERLAERTVYGEAQGDAGNHRTRVYQVFDAAGVVTSEAYDFKGNLLAGKRELLPDYKQAADWAQNPAPDGGTFLTSTTYDALNRPLTVTTPDGSVYRPTFNEANLLDKVEVNLRGAAAATPFVTDIDYNAKGQRTLIDYGNGVRTTYEYDPLTYRLLHLLTRRDPGAFPEDCPEPPPSNWPGCQVQNLRYTYDPAGNITHIRDDAQQTIYFKNKRVEPRAEYTYDAVYRLVEATGREQLGQGGVSIPHSYDDAPRVRVLSADAAGRFGPNDGNAMGCYIERYLYDAVGNFRQMQHLSGDPTLGWTRSYAYNETSFIENGMGSTLLKTSNRLSSTAVGNNNPITEQYTYDAHGNMLHMPQLQIMQWDFKDQLQMTQRQKVNGADAEGVQHQGERTWYVYDAAGQRVRKVTELANGNLKDERIYLGGFEIYRKNGMNPLVRETLHIMDDKQRIALVETRTQGDDPAPLQLIRYQFSNHLGSASLELDDKARIISYEEYTPYGSTSYQAVRNQTETPRRYRYTGKERDEETGLYHHGARYYAPWLGRWTAADPAGLVDGPGLYNYVGGNPVGLNDPNGREGLKEWEGGQQGSDPGDNSVDEENQPGASEPEATSLCGEECEAYYNLSREGRLEVERQWAARHREAEAKAKEAAAMPRYETSNAPLPPTGHMPPGYTCETFPQYPGYEYCYKEPDTRAAEELGNLALLALPLVDLFSAMGPGIAPKAPAPKAPAPRAVAPKAPAPKTPAPKTPATEAVAPKAPAEAARPLEATPPSETGARQTSAVDSPISESTLKAIAEPPDDRLVAAVRALEDAIQRPTRLLDRFRTVYNETEMPPTVKAPYEAPYDPNLRVNIPPVPLLPNIPLTIIGAFYFYNLGSRGVKNK